MVVAERSVRFRQPSIRLTIALAFAGAALLLGTISSLIVSQITQTQIERDQGEIINLTAQQMARTLDRVMFERYREVRIVSALPSMRNPLFTPTQRREVLEQMQSSFPYYAWIGYLGPTGKVIAATDELLENADVSQRPVFQEGQKGPFVGDVHEAILLADLLGSENGEKLEFVDVAAPIVSESGEFLGVLAAHIYWRWANDMRLELLNELEADRNQLELFVFNHAGNMLLGPFEENQQSTITPVYDSEEGGFQVTQWGDGKNYLTSMAQTDGYLDYPGLGWQVMVRQPTEIAFAPARQVQSEIFLIGTLISLLFILLGIGIAERISRPLISISQAAKRIQAGDMEISIPTTNGRDEVGILSTTLSSMVTNLKLEIQQKQEAEESLRVLNRDLEMRVKERTTALQKANERLQELDRLKSKFVADVSHELRNPVTSLLLRIDLLERSPQQLVHHVNVLRDQSEQLKSLVESILDILRLERAGQLSNTFAPVDINLLLQQALERHRINADHAGLTLTLEAEQDLPPVLGEAGQLEQVVTNLVGNAIKYTPQGEVTVKTFATPTHVCMTVHDTGMGIPKEDLRHLFERFYRGKQVSKSKIPGTGLGLSIVHEIVATHGGEITVESEPGSGSTFSVWLPKLSTLA